MSCELHAQTHTQYRTHTNTHAHTHKHTCTHTHAHHNTYHICTHMCIRMHVHTHTHTHTHTHKGSNYINIGVHEMHGQQTNKQENAHTSCTYTHSQLPDPECQGWLQHWVGHWQFVDYHQRQPKQVQSFHPGSNIIQKLMIISAYRVAA